jgi:hypothetical protein
VINLARDRFRFLVMARTQLPNLALPRSPEDGLAGSGSAFDTPFTAGMRAVGIAGQGASATIAGCKRG